MTIIRKLKSAYDRAYRALIENCDLWQQLLNIAVVIALVG